MRCSECSKEVKPIVCLDIDGTLAQYHQHFYDFACDYWGRTLCAGYDGSMEMHEWLKLSLEAYRETKLAYRQGGGKRTIPPYPGATDLVRRLHDVGAEVWLTTTRPYLRLDSTDPDTRFWLERHGIKYDYLLYNEDKYKELAGLVDRARVVAILDDLPSQLAAAEELYGPVVPIQHVNDSNWGNQWHGSRVRSLEHAWLEMRVRLSAWFQKNKSANSDSLLRTPLTGHTPYSQNATGDTRASGSTGELKTTSSTPVTR